MSNIEAKWYVVNTYSGYENKVKVTIEKVVVNRRLEDKIFEIVIPMHNVVDASKEGSEKKQKKICPGYVLINMILTDETWYIVRNTRGVTGFVGIGQEPTPLTEKEIREMNIDVPIVSIDFKVGDRVEIIDGSLKGQEAILLEIDTKKSIALVEVEMFSRKTSMEVQLTSIKKSSI